MRTKILTVCLLILCVQLFASDKLGVFVDVKRFLDTNKNTRFVMDYQVPYKNMMFQQRDKSYFAEIKVLLSISNADSVIYNKEFTNNIGVTSKYDLSSSSKSFVDRISLTLSKPGLKIRVQFKDINAATEYDWNYIPVLLNRTDRLSDIELISYISPDTTIYSQKFIRSGKSHIPEPSGLVSKDYSDSLYIYCEAYDTKSDDSKATLIIKKDNKTSQISTIKARKSSQNEFLFPVKIEAMEPGKYIGTLEFEDEDQKYSKTCEFIITEKLEKLYFLFADTEDELKLMKYLFSVKNQMNWDTMSSEAKRRYTSKLWMEFASRLNQPIDDVLKLYKSRIDYCNTNFSHFEKGWKTDMGRIYIKNGKPDDIDSDTTSDETKFVRKDFQIWKYSGGIQAVYLFVDIPMNGNYKLVYAKNDDSESSYPNWGKYLGSDFDESRLDN